MRKTALLAVALLFVAGGVTHAEDPECITSDTPAYCAKLARQMNALSYMPPHARTLRAEGQAMCEHGQVRAGLARLRRAMVIVHSENNQ